MHLHNCQGCGQFCGDHHPLCLWCRDGKPAPQETPEVATATLSPAILRQIGGEEASVIVRYPSPIARKINRREARKKRDLRRRRRSFRLRRALGFLSWTALALYLLVTVILGTFALVDHAAFALGFHKEIF